jgi:hypothetical protein
MKFVCMSTTLFSKIFYFKLYEITDLESRSHTNKKLSCEGTEGDISYTFGADKSVLLWLNFSAKLIG